MSSKYVINLTITRRVMGITEDTPKLLEKIMSQDVFEFDGRKVCVVRSESEIAPTGALVYDVELEDEGHV